MSKYIRITDIAFDNLQRRVKLSDPLGTRNRTSVLVDRLLFECPLCPHNMECLANEHSNCIKGQDILESR